MRANERILYVVQGIPGSNAPTKHAFAIADLMTACGYAPYFMVAGIADPGLPALKERFDYPVEFPEVLRLGNRQLVAKYTERLTSFASISAFRDAMTRIQPAAVVYYGIQNNLANAIVGECRAEGVPVLVDETDWFEAHFEGDLASWIVAKSRERRVQDADEAADGILAISPFFKEHFESVEKAKGAPCVMFLPPLNRQGEAIGEMQIPPVNSRASTRFFYAGSPAGKDYLEGFIEAMVSCTGSLKTVPRLDVVGMSPAEGKTMMKNHGISDLVYFHGRLPHAEVLSMLRQADFGILFRQPALYARAGFSTKFAECMSNGVPMLCNAVGGADLVLESGIDGIVVPDLSADSLVNGLTTACNIDDTPLHAMKCAALAKSEELFRPENYVGEFSEFMESLTRR